MRRAADITTRPLELSDLLEGIAAGVVVLPDFQRDFEWQEAEVLSLVATVMAGWPAGSLLLMRGKPRFFETRPFDGMPRSDVVQYVVLDGQQRLTALSRALRGVAGEAAYAVDLNAISEGAEVADELEEAFRPVRPGKDDWIDHDRALVPLTALNSAPDYFEWIEDQVLTLAEDQRAPMRARLRNAYKDFLGTVNHYAFPSVILEPDMPTAAVARIFERINKGGLQLGTFDLLVARVYKRGWNLREKWEQAKADDELFGAYLGDDGLPLIQSITVAPRAPNMVGDIRRPALLKVDEEPLRQQWDVTVESYARALQFISDSGMRNPNWVPYRILHVPLAALARNFELAEHRELLEAWLWSRSFNMDYDVASSTVATSDYILLRDALSGMGTPPSFSIDLGPLWGATRKSQGALWRTFLSFLLRRGALDPWTGARLIESPTDASGVVVDHIVVEAQRPDGDDSPHLSVLAQYVRQRRRGASADLRGLPRETDTGNALRSQFLEAIVEGDIQNSFDAMQARLAALRIAVIEEFPAVKTVSAPTDF